MASTPPGFAGEDATGWEDRRASILYVASQVRTSQQVELARTNLVRLRHRAEVVPIEPVPYSKVRGVGFYRQFLSTRDWGEFMAAGRAETRRELAARYGVGTGGDGAGDGGRGAGGASDAGGASSAEGGEAGHFGPAGTGRQPVS